MRHPLFHCATSETEIKPLAASISTEFQKYMKQFCLVLYQQMQEELIQSKKDNSSLEKQIESCFHISYFYWQKVKKNRKHINSPETKKKSNFLKPSSQSLHPRLNIILSNIMLSYFSHLTECQ